MGASSPHSSSISRPAETTRPALVARSPTTARCFAPEMATTRSSSRISSGPSTATRSELPTTFARADATQSRLSAILGRYVAAPRQADLRTLRCRTEEEPIGHEEGNGDPLDGLRIALAAMRACEELADPAVRVHAERYLARADEEIAYVAALAGRTDLVGGDDDRKGPPLDRAVRAVRLAGAKLDAAIAEK